MRWRRSFSKNMPKGSGCIVRGSGSVLWGSFGRHLRSAHTNMPSAMYVERTRICQANPPPASWNGVFVMETK